MIYDKAMFKCRTWMEVVNILFNMGVELENSIDERIENKQDKLIVGNGIEISEENVISVLTDMALDSESTNPVANSLLTQFITELQNLFEYTDVIIEES